MPTGPFSPTSRRESFATRRIGGGSIEAWRNSLNYKALKSRRSRELTSMKYDLKSNDAVWDPNIGPNGGWRCGTDVTAGGEFTDRWGRGCGGRVRRLGRAIARSIGRAVSGRGGKNPARIAESVNRQLDASVNRERARDANWWEAFGPQKPSWLSVQERVMESIRSDERPIVGKVRAAIKKIESDLDLVSRTLDSGRLTAAEQNLQKIREDIYRDDLIYLESLLEDAFENEMRTSRPIGFALSRLPTGGPQEDALRQVRAETDAWRLRIDETIQNGTLRQLRDLSAELTKETADNFAIQMDKERSDVDRAIATGMVQFYRRRLPEVEEAARVRKRMMKSQKEISAVVQEAARTKVRRQVADPIVESWLADPIVAADYLRSPVSAKTKQRGRLAAIPDEYLIEAMIGDDTIVDKVGTDYGAGVPVPSIRPDDPISAKDILRSEAGGFPVGTVVSNSRFEFEMIKNNAFRQVWSVWRVRDKDTGEIYFLKGSSMSANEAVAEMAGAELAGLVGYNTDKRFGGVRVDKRRGGSATTRGARWALIRHVGHYQGDSKTGEQLATYKSAAKIASEGGAGVTFVEIGQDASSARVDVLDLGPEETAKLTLLDYLLDNHDRHFGNFFLYMDNDNNMRVAPIDHGIVTGGEVDRGLSSAVSADALAEDAAFRASLTPEEFVANVMHPIFNYVHVKESQRDQYRKEIEKLLSQITEQAIDEMLSPENFARRGMTLSATERAHLAAIREVAKSRLAILRTRGSRLMLEPFKNRLEVAVSAAEIAANAETVERTR